MEHPPLSEEDRRYFGASIRHSEEGIEYYSAREVFHFLGYTKWPAFRRAFDRARNAYRPLGNVYLHFRPIERQSRAGRKLRAIDDYHLSREAFLLVIAHADNSLPMVAHGKNYLAESALAAQAALAEEAQESRDPFLPPLEEQPAEVVSFFEEMNRKRSEARPGTAQEYPTMSTVKTFLVLIFSDWAENWREELLIMDEEQALFELERAGMNAYPERRERHLLFELKEPLTRKQLDWLEGRKRAGLFLNFMVQDEITPVLPEGYA